MKCFFRRKKTEIHSIGNYEKPIIAERSIRTLKNKTWKHMTAISTNIYFDK